MKITDILLNAGRGEVSHQIVEWHNGRKCCDNEVCLLSDGSVALRDDAFMCEECEEMFLTEECCSFYGQRGNEVNCCESCRDDNSFFCYENQSHYSTRRYTCITIGRHDYCLEACDDVLYYWECDGEYHLQPEPNEEDGVAGYHELHRPWKHKSHPPSAIGVELETYADDAMEHAEMAMAIGLLAERDGSLDDTHGVEIVGPPMLMGEYLITASPWHKLFSKSEFKAWDAGTGYGMHVNLNREGMTKIHQCRFVRFIHDNKPFCEHIAGRKENHWAQYSKKTLACYRRDGEKYEAAAMREGRIEVRIFRATRKVESFLKNIEFVDAVREFTQETRCDYSLFEFLQFVKTRSSWLNLSAWLKAKGAN